MTTTGTIDNPATGTVPVEYSIGANILRSLGVTVDLSSLGVGTEWEFDCVHTIEGRQGRDALLSDRRRRGRVMAVQFFWWPPARTRPVRVSLCTARMFVT